MRGLGIKNYPIKHSASSASRASSASPASPSSQQLTGGLAAGGEAPYICMYVYLCIVYVYVFVCTQAINETVRRAARRTPADQN